MLPTPHPGIQSFRIVPPHPNSPDALPQAGFVDHFVTGSEQKILEPANLRELGDVDVDLAQGQMVLRKAFSEAAVIATVRSTKERIAVPWGPATFYGVMIVMFMALSFH